MPSGKFEKCAIICKLKTVIFAIITRAIFTTHCAAAFGMIYKLTDEWDNINWLLLSGIVGLLVETVTTIYVRKGAEYKWFCPSVFFYLMTIVPCVWVLELDMLADEMSKCSTEFEVTNITENSKTLLQDDLLESLPPIEPRTALVAIEQLLLFVLILGRWMLPKGDISRDELSQLLLVYIGMAADIIEFFEAFKEGTVRCTPTLINIILGIWAGSLLQFTLVLTASKSKKGRAGFGEPEEERMCQCCEEACHCCGTEVFGILTTVVLQDGPFLALRLLLLIKYEVYTYMHIFFTVKNSLVLVLMFYRLFVLFGTKKETHLQDMMIEISSASKKGQPQSEDIELLQGKKNREPPSTKEEPEPEDESTHAIIP